MSTHPQNLFEVVKQALSETPIMSVADMFLKFVDNLGIKNSESISLRYGELTASLNKRFRETESKTANSLQVGSIGRSTAINGISDLDMLYIMPRSKWETYRSGGQGKLLADVRAAIKERYPSTNVRVDRLVVTVTYKNFHVEVQPVFEEEDGSFKYPDTLGDGSWKVTRPREEIEAALEADADKNYNFRRLCKMARAWKNKHGVGIGGLLIDTLAFNFINQTSSFDSSSYSSYDLLIKEFFKYLSELPDQEFYGALGSGQRVRVKKKFQKRAKKAYNLVLEAIAAEGTVGANGKWKKVFGRPFPSGAEVVEGERATKGESNWRDTEEFIEDRFPVDIRWTLKIDCIVKQNGFRDQLLSFMLKNKWPLLTSKQLTFNIVANSVPGRCEIFWKVLNRGSAAKKRDCVRGQILPDDGNLTRVESTSFRGDHIVECYAVLDGVVVAKDRIHVPIKESNEF